MVKDYRNGSADRWYRGLLDNAADFPISFIYGGEEINGFSEHHFCEKSRRVERDGEREDTFVIYDFRGELEFTLKLSHYYDYGATEWTVWIENKSDRDSKVIERLESKLVFEGALPTLNGILGDHVNYYRPYSIPLADGTVTEYSSDIGRATHINFPYFNIEYGDGGAMLAIGWAGTWHASFRSSGGRVEYTAGAVNNMHTCLHPGEKIRTALFVLARYTVRDRFYATNYWRSWYIKHNLPKADKEGNGIEPFSTCCIAYDTGYRNTDGSMAERHTTWRPSLEKMLSEDVKVDFRWFDAGWYVAPDGRSPDGEVWENDWWATVGTWELDPVKWPGDSFLESTEFAREHGMKTLAWFEPERITDPDNLVKKYGYKKEWAVEIEGTLPIVNNIGNDECREWVTERICKMLRHNKVEMYREDNNNADPAMLWKHLDQKEGDDRCGITEFKLIMAHYKLWDDIIECTLSYGGCGFVDSCASGGGRNDLESMRRGVPLLRSDHDRMSCAIRLSMTTALNCWLPVCGALNREKKGELAPEGQLDRYIWRASYLPILNVDSQFVHAPDDGDYFDTLRFGLKEWKKLSRYLMKDFYPLTPWHSEYDKAGFTSYAFYDPETDDGYLFAFRQEECGCEALTVSLPFAEAGEGYLLHDVDTDEKIRYTAEELRRGIRLMFDSPRSDRLIFVSKE